MSEPNKCKWCGCSETLTSADVLVRFGCESAYLPERNQWVVSNGCADKLQDRIRRALETLKAAKRHDFVVNFMSSMQRRDDGDFVEFDDVEQAVKILEDEND